jgi:hypothetical protein
MLAFLLCIVVFYGVLRTVVLKNGYIQGRSCYGNTILIIIKATTQQYIECKYLHSCFPLLSSMVASRTVVFKEWLYFKGARIMRTPSQRSSKVKKLALSGGSLLHRSSRKTARFSACVVTV